MKFIEDVINISQNGTLTLDSNYLSAMGLSPGDEINIAFMVNDERANAFAEFLISPAFDGSDDNTNHIFIPHELLINASILPYSDVNITCIDGAVVIYQSEGFDPSELSKLLSSLHLASDFLQNLAFENFNEGSPPKNGRIQL